jgi:diaminopimelate decarboxylase
MAPVIRDAIRSEFPAGVTTIAEPGRFFARSVYTLVCRVISRRRQLGSAALSGVPDMLYQNDGIYGNFMNVIMEKEIMVPYLVKNKKARVLLHKPKSEDALQVTDHRYSIWGPTCDSTDCVVREVTFDSEVKVGDWLKYKNMGGECCHFILGGSTELIVFQHIQVPLLLSLMASAAPMTRFISTVKHCLTISHLGVSFTGYLWPWTH